MKKILSFLAAAGFVCAALSGCVDDNQYVVAKGLVVGGDCNPTSEDQTYFISAICNPSGGGKVYSWLHIMNYVTGKLPWSSAGGGSGTTFEAEVVNPGVIFIDKIMIECRAIDGDPSGCNGVEPIPYPINQSVNGSGGGICASFPFDFGTIASWGGNEVTVDVYAKYHDSSLIKGETSHVASTFTFAGNAGPCNEITKDDEETPAN